ncbi:MAG: hypothetical protein ACWA49_01025 [Ruegeria sp.]
MAREVISRVLPDFQKRDLTTKSRGRITLTNRPALQFSTGRAGIIREKSWFP